MNSLSMFGLFAVTAMMVCYALEKRSPWFILAFSAACALGSVYGFLRRERGPSALWKRCGRWWPWGGGGRLPAPPTPRGCNLCPPGSASDIFLLPLPGPEAVFPGHLRITGNEL